MKNFGIVFIILFMQQVAVANQPLSITLVKFSVAQSNNHIILNWTTHSENNTAEYTLERSQDGIEYKGILERLAPANTSAATEYSGTDLEPTSGHNYYRLKRTSLDGETDYSHVISIEYKELLQPVVFPNPCTQDKVGFSIPEDGTLLRIISATGRILLEERYDSGNYEISMDEIRSEEGQGFFCFMFSSGTNVSRLKILFK